MKLLILSGGSLVGQNLLESLAGRRQDLRLVAANSVPDEPSLFGYDRVYLTPPTHSPGFEARLRELLEAERPDLVVPGRDDDVAWLAGFGERNPDLAARLLCGSRAAAEIMHDKLASWHFARGQDLPFVPTIAASDCGAGLPPGFSLPLLAKPRSGFASRGIYLLNQPSQLAAIAALPDYVLQPWLGAGEELQAYLEALPRLGVPLHHSFEPPKYAIQTLLLAPGRWLPAFCTRHRMRSGASLGLEAFPDPALSAIGEACARAFSAIGWRGPLNIQCLQSPTGYLIHEFSGRFTGATAARLQLGYDEIGAALKSLLGFELPAPAAPVASVERRLVCRVLPPGAAEQLRQHGSWTSPLPGGPGGASDPGAEGAGPAGSGAG